MCMIHLLLSMHQIENFGNFDGTLGSDSCGNNFFYPRTFTLIFTRVRLLDNLLFLFRFVFIFFCAAYRISNATYWQTRTSERSERSPIGTAEPDNTLSHNGNMYLIQQMLLQNNSFVLDVARRGSNKVSSCFFSATAGNLHSLQKSVTIKCRGSTLLVQRSLLSKFADRKLRANFFDAETHDLLDSSGDFDDVNISATEINAKCHRDGNRVLVKALAKRRHGVNYVDVIINSEPGESAPVRSHIQQATMVGGLCQSGSLSAKQEFIVGKNKAACVEKTISFPESNNKGHGVLFDDKCGPASWKEEEPLVNLIAAKHPDLDALCIA